MKTLTHMLNFLLMLWLSLFSMGDIKSIPDLVLCIGQDGHIEVEEAIDRRCGAKEPAAFPATKAPTLAAENESHCGGCSDIPMFAEGSRTQSQRQSAGTNSGHYPAGALDITRESRHALPPTRLNRISPPPILSPTLAALATVRLLV